jgi:hypothetical protein
MEYYDLFFQKQDSAWSRHLTYFRFNPEVKQLENP